MYVVHKTIVHYISCLHFKHPLFLLIFSDGSDYQAVGPLDFTFDRSTNSHDIIIPIINDNIHERVERFNGVLKSSEDPDVLILNPANTVIEILDDDGMYVSWCIIL